jgi:hypothetical protein
MALVEIHATAAVERGPPIRALRARDFFGIRVS